MQGLLKMLQLSGASRLAGTQLVPQARPAVSRNMATKVKAAAVGKKDLVTTVAHNAGLTTAQAERAVNSLLGAIVETVAKGEKVTVVGFGTFERRHRAARKGRNPSTGAELDIPESHVPAFSAGKAFKEKVKADAKK